MRSALISPATRVLAVKVEDGEVGEEQPEGFEVERDLLALLRTIPKLMGDDGGDGKGAGLHGVDLRQRVRDLVDAIVASRISVTGAVADLPGVMPRYVEQAAELIESNALRIARRLG